MEVSVNWLGDKSSEPVYYFQDTPETYQKLNIGLTRRSQVNLVPKSSTLQLFTKDPDQADEAFYKKGPQISLGNDSNRFLILFYPKPNGSIDHLSFNDSIQDFPGGTIRVINLVEKPIIAVFGNEDFPIPGGNENFRLRSGADKKLDVNVSPNERFAFRILYRDDNGNPVAASAKTLRLRSDNQRLFVVVTYRPDNKVLLNSSLGMEHKERDLVGEQNSWSNLEPDPLYLIDSVDS